MPNWVRKILRLEKRTGIRQRDMVNIYISIVRPVLEYARPVWSTSVSQYLSDSIEMVQKRALRAIYPGLYYDDILLLLAIPSLEERRENICKLYFDRLTCTEHKLHHLLPVERGVTYDLRNQNTYPLPLTRTDRFKNYLIPCGFYHWQ